MWLACSSSRCVGVGDVTARKWFHDGSRTLDDVRKRRDLPERRIVGLKYFDDSQKRIPAAVVSQVEESVQDTCTLGPFFSQPLAFLMKPDSFCSGF